MKRIATIAVLGLMVANGLQAKEEVTSRCPEYIFNESDFVVDYGAKLHGIDNYLYSKEGYSENVKTVSFGAGSTFIEYDKKGRMVVQIDKNEDINMPIKTDYIYHTNLKDHTICRQKLIHHQNNGVWDEGKLDAIEDLFNKDGWRIATLCYGDTLDKINYDNDNILISVWRKEYYKKLYTYKEDGEEIAEFKWNGEERKWDDKPNSLLKFDKHGFIIESYYDGELEERQSNVYTYYPTGEIESITVFDSNKNKVEETRYNKEGKTIETQMGNGSVITKKSYDKNGLLTDEESIHYIYTYKKGKIVEIKAFIKDQLISITTYDQYGNQLKSTTYQNGKVTNTYVTEYTYFE